MFDVGFSELLLTGLIALLVIGPERLPKVARTIGLWTGRARRFLATVKEDFDRELKAEELKRMMQEQAKSSGIHEIIEETRETVAEVKQTEYLVKAADEKPSAPHVTTPPPAAMPTQEQTAAQPSSSQIDDKHAKP